MQVKHTEFEVEVKITLHYVHTAFCNKMHQSQSNYMQQTRFLNQGIIVKHVYLIFTEKCNF